MSEHDQSPSELAAEIVRETSHETLEELGRLAVNHQREAGLAEGARRRQNQLTLERVTAEVADRLVATGYPNAELIETEGYRSRPERFDLRVREAGWTILRRTTERNSRVSVEESFALLARDLISDSRVFMKTSVTSVNGQAGMPRRSVVQSSNVATLTQQDFDLLIQNMENLGRDQV